MKTTEELRKTWRTNEIPDGALFGSNHVEALLDDIDELQARLRICECGANERL